MSDQADNPGIQPEAGAAPASEPTIPKWRLDEIAARLRAAQEELEMKNQLLNQFRPQPTQNQGPTPEEVGLDAQTAQAVQRLATHIADQKLRAAAAPLQHQMANMANRMEETQFLLNHGKDKSKYLDKIKEQRQRHFQQTGGYMGVEDAYKLVMFDELMSRTQAKPAGQTNQNQAAPAANGPEAQSGGGIPDASQTRGTGGTNQPASKSFDEMTFEEKEAYLDRQLGSGNTL
jgi:hypothetical protein